MILFMILFNGLRNVIEPTRFEKHFIGQKIISIILWNILMKYLMGLQNAIRPFWFENIL